MYKGMNKTELKDICQSRGLKGLSTLSKEALINKIMRSYFEEDKNIPVAVAVTTAEIINHEPRVLPIGKLEVKSINKATKEEPKPSKNRTVATERLQMEAEKRELAEAEAEIVRLETEAAKEKAEIAKAEEELAKAKAEAKKKKASIPKKVKTDVWNTYIGADINKHRCLCCKKTIISNTDFDVGHVMSESCGGTLEICNLRPICSACNHAMGTQNMVDFVKTYGYFIG
jgi:flagellar biosynthesis GTPase FlhF